MNSQERLDKEQRVVMATAKHLAIHIDGLKDDGWDALRSETRAFWVVKAIGLIKVQKKALDG